MFSKLNKKSKLSQGFTIIEVMIVLAIAGLILVVVLIAIPQLQRNQRNESRRSVASRIVTEISNYAGNNNGNLPAANVTTSAATNFGHPGLALGFFDRYMDCNPATVVAPATKAGTCTTNINDPRTGVPVGTGNDGANVIDTTVIAVGGAPATTAGSIGYGVGQTCLGETSETASNRNFVFMMRLEGGAVFCLDNK